MQQQKTAMTILPLVLRTAQFAAAAILFWSSTEHLKNQQHFLVSLLRYQIIDGVLAEFVAVLLPVVQVVLAVFLVSGVQSRVTSLAAALLFVFFAGVQTSALARDLPISCGCFGPQSSDPISIASVLQVFGFAVAMSLVFFFESARCNRDQTKLDWNQS